MITVQEASEIINNNLFKPTTEQVQLADAIGRVLAEPISADRDFPPFNRVMMDGIAIKFEKWDEGQRQFKREATQMAGEPQKSLEKDINCIEVMTGAMLPKNTDTVIPYEELQIEGEMITISSPVLKSGQNIHNQGNDVKVKELILDVNTLISTAEIGVLATVGKSKLVVKTMPKVAIISTGDELVPIDESPKPHQIRQSNSHVLKASLTELKIQAEIFHIVDDKEVLQSRLASILDKHDAIILSGGVSKGKKDYVPEVLAELKVKKHFHGVVQRPGKPFWFGTRDDNKTIFALPGNPVSTYMCFQKYVRSWIHKSLGIDVKEEYAMLSEDFNFKKELTYFLQVMVLNEKGLLMALPVAGQGSGDLANLISADGFLELPSDRVEFKKDEAFTFIRYR